MALGGKNYYYLTYKIRIETYIRQYIIIFHIISYYFIFFDLSKYQETIIGRPTDRQTGQDAADKFLDHVDQDYIKDCEQKADEGSGDEAAYGDGGGGGGRHGKKGKGKGKGKGARRTPKSEEARAHTFSHGIRLG